MRLRLLFALLFCLAAWGSLGQPLPASTDTSTRRTANIHSETATEVPGGTSDADSQGHAGHPAIVTVTESLWSSPVVHADLAGVRSGDVFIEARHVGRRDRPSRTGSTHLLHIPLLI